MENGDGMIRWRASTEDDDTDDDRFLQRMEDEDGSDWDCELWSGRGRVFL